MNKRIVLKIGSAVLTSSSRKVLPGAFYKIAKDVALLKKSGYETVLVSSGAIMMAMKLLNLKKRPDRVEDLQRLAAIGQPELMSAYKRAFRKNNLMCAQVLLTHYDFEKRTNFLNARRTLLGLLKEGIIPIVNENDTVAVEEIKVGDNDTLSTLVATAVEAKNLIFLSSVPGVINPETGEVIKKIKTLDRAKKFDTGEKTDSGVGGLSTKLNAAKIALKQGISVYLGEGMNKDLIPSFLNRKFIGTTFAPLKKTLKGKRKWLSIIQRVRGRIFIDRGAEKAILKRGKSLLPGGIIRVEGQFLRGDVVEVVTFKGQAIAKGLSAYSFHEIEKIMGKKTSEIDKILGYKYSDEVIHRNDIVLLK